MSLAAERPIFVVGVPRSGTTLLRYMLCSHPRIYIPPESGFIPRFAQYHPHAPLQPQQAIDILNTILNDRWFLQDWQRERPNPVTFVDSLPELMPATLLDALYRQYAHQFGAARWGDKTPIYTDYIDLIAELFPIAQFIHIIRDGRDAALSMLGMKANQTSRFFYMDIYYAARTWEQSIRRARACGSWLGTDRYYEVRYEQLTAHPEALLRDICDFLGEVYVPAMAEPHMAARKHHSSKGRHAATRQPLTTKSVARWRREMSAADLQLFQAVAGDLLEELGYETVAAGKPALAAKTRYVGLRTKYAILEAGRHTLRAAGVFHPTALLPERAKA